jgi:hypothetical protein
MLKPPGYLGRVLLQAASSKGRSIITKISIAEALEGVRFEEGKTREAAARPGELYFRFLFAYNVLAVLTT